VPSARVHVYFNLEIKWQADSGLLGTLPYLRPYVCGSRTLFTLFHVKFDGVALSEILKVEPLKAAAVKENLPLVSGVDKTERPLANDLLNCPLHISLPGVKAAVLGWSKK
jgi:hypothetical protein